MWIFMFCIMFVSFEKKKLIPLFLLYNKKNWYFSHLFACFPTNFSKDIRISALNMCANKEKEKEGNT